MKQAIIEDVNDWKKITDENQKAKAIKKMRMLYGHITMWNIKLEEVTSEGGQIDKPLPFKDIN